MRSPLPQPSRRNEDSLSTPQYYKGSKRVFDAASGVTTVKLFSGDWYVSADASEMLTTILGSCVSACVRDPIAGIGGMNHFLLPGDETTVSDVSDAARYGVFAMERLINAILHAGGQRERLEIKVFGGSNVINNSIRIGSKNAAFIRHFLQQEGFRTACEDLEGDTPRRVHYFPVTGRVMLRKLNRREDLQVIDDETRYRREIAAQPVEGAIDLF